MHLKPQQRVNVVVPILVGFYLVTAFVPMMHIHKDGIDSNRCTVCYYYQNHHFQDLPGQFSVQQSSSFQIVNVFESFGYAPKIVFLFDSSRAPPRLHLV